jgi:hypothetical protein
MDELNGTYIKDNLEALHTLQNKPQQQQQRSARANPANEALHATKRAWMQIIDKADHEFIAWEAAKKQWIATQHAAPLELTSSAASGTAADDAARRAKQAADAADAQLARCIPEAYQFVSVKSDLILSGMKRIAQQVDAAHRFQDSVADSVTSASLVAAAGVDDPKSLIQIITAAGDGPVLSSSSSSSQ